MSPACCWVLGAVCALGVQNAEPDRRVLVIDLLGEVTDDPGGAARFGRGVSVYPQLGTPVVAATAEDADMVYGQPATFHTRIGFLHQDAARPAFLLTHDLLAKHFAIVGSTGSRKSCALTLLLPPLLQTPSFPP